LTHDFITVDYGHCRDHNRPLVHDADNTGRRSLLEA
jgi:hypothetical protein